MDTKSGKGMCVTAGTLAGQVLGTRRAVRAVRPPA
jgi:hypothetical protein